MLNFIILNFIGVEIADLCQTYPGPGFFAKTLDKFWNRKSGKADLDADHALPLDFPWQ